MVRADATQVIGGEAQANFGETAFLFHLFRDRSCNLRSDPADTCDGRKTDRAAAGRMRIPLHM